MSQLVETRRRAPGGLPRPAAALLGAPLIAAGGVHVLFAVGALFALLTAWTARRFVDLAPRME